MIAEDKTTLHTVMTLSLLGPEMESVQSLTDHILANQRNRNLSRLGNL